LLLQHKDINVNIQNIYGYSALIRASKYGKVEVVKQLLQYKDIDITLKNNEGETALDKADTAEIENLIRNHKNK